MLAAAVAPSAAAQEAPPPTRQEINQARRLGRQAARTARRGNWGEAARLYGQAEELHQLWKYPFALAEGHLKTGSLPLAWRALQRTQDYGVPSRHQRKYEELLERVESQLLDTHAFIALVSVPENADVRINGQQWLPPYNMWVPRNFSRIEIEHPQYITRVFNWHHGKGQRHARPVALVSKRTYGRLTVEGQPAGAEVQLDGRAIGRLPRATTDLMKPGPYPVRVEHAPDWLPSEEIATVVAGKTVTMQVSLEPSASDFERMLQTKSFWGWTFTGTGGAALITGIALLGVASASVSDAEDLNRSHSAGYADYVRQYEDTTSGIDGLVTGGWVLFGVGLAMAATGATLLALHYGEDGEGSGGSADARPDIRFDFVPLGAGAGAQMRF